MLEHYDHIEHAVKASFIGANNIMQSGLSEPKQMLLYMGFGGGVTGAMTLADISIKILCGLGALACIFIAYSNHRKQSKLLDLQLKEFEKKQL